MGSGYKFGAHSTAATGWGSPPRDISSKMALRPVLAVLAALVVAAAAIENQNRDLPCPDEVAILPCTCHTNEYLLMSLDCSLVKTYNDLERAFNATFPFIEFYELTIEHDPEDSQYQLTELRSDVLHDLSFQSVIITGTKIQVIEENVFSYSRNTLTQLDLQNNMLTRFPFESIDQYVKLEILLLDYNQLPTLEKFSSDSLKTLSVGHNDQLGFTQDVLEYLPNLENLNMEAIGLKVIPQHIVQNLTKIFFLNFNDNDLTELEEYTFDPLTTSLSIILLANNRINEIRYNAINEILPGGIIDLTNNKIAELTQYIWQPILDQILDGMLDLTGNPLVCGCDMNWLFLNTSTVDSSEVYLPIITDHTTCFDGTQLSFLDYRVFEKHCT